MATRHPEGWRTRLKMHLENRGIARCLAFAPLPTAGVLDVPCGPGRLFAFWQTLGVPVYGMDFSTDFVEAAAEFHKELGLTGWVKEGDIFDREGTLARIGGDVPSIIASIRFVYYFKGSRRHELLTKMAGLGSEWLLTQYMVAESAKMRLTRFKRWITGSRKHGRGHHLKKFHLTRDEITRELAGAGWEALHFEPVAPFSNRCLVMCRRRNA